MTDWKRGASDRASLGREQPRVLLQACSSLRPQQPHTQKLITVFMSCYFDSYFLSGKQTGVLGRQPRQGPWNRARGNLPRPRNRGDKSLIFWGILSLFFCYFGEEMGTFHVGVVWSQKICCSPGVVERKRCPRARFWSGSAPADRDVRLSRPGHGWLGQQGK